MYFGLKGSWYPGASDELPIREPTSPLSVLALFTINRYTSSTFLAPGRRAASLPYGGTPPLSVDKAMKTGIGTRYRPALKERPAGRGPGFGWCLMSAGCQCSRCTGPLRVCGGSGRVRSFICPSGYRRIQKKSIKPGEDPSSSSQSSLVRPHISTCRLSVKALAVQAGLDDR